MTLEVGMIWVVILEEDATYDYMIDPEGLDRVSQKQQSKTCQCLNFYFLLFASYVYFVSNSRSVFIF